MNHLPSLMFIIRARVWSFGRWWSSAASGEWWCWLKCSNYKHRKEREIACVCMCVCLCVCATYLYLYFIIRARVSSSIRWWWLKCSNYKHREERKRIYVCVCLCVVSIPISLHTFLTFSTVVWKPPATRVSVDHTYIHNTGLEMRNTGDKNNEKPPAADH